MKLATPHNFSDGNHCSRCGERIQGAGDGGVCARCFAEICLRSSGADVEGTPTPAPRPGTRLGNYELVEEIGRGGMGVVFRARQIGLDRDVALKCLLFGASPSSEQVRRFLVEASASAKLRHANIVAVHEVGEDDGHLYYTMNLIEGPSLGEVLRAGPLRHLQATDLGAKIARAVDHAHRNNILHRDLKPANILLDTDTQPKVADFGLARPLTEPSTITVTGEILGTPAYMSPEQARGLRPLDARTDIYSIGALLYQTLTGHAPFVGASAADTLRLALETEPVAPHLLNPDIPRDLEAVTLKCLSKERERRYSTALELAEDLERVLQGIPTRARPAGWVELAWRWGRRRPAVVALILLLAIASGIGLAAEFRGRRQVTTALREPEQLVGYLTTNLATRLSDLGQLRILDDLNQTVATHFTPSRLAEANESTLFAYASLQQHIGIANRGWTRQEAAAGNFERASLVLERLRRKQPQNLDWHRQWVSARAEWASALTDARRFASADAVLDPVKKLLIGVDSTKPINAWIAPETARFHLAEAKLRTEIGTPEEIAAAVSRARALVLAHGDDPKDKLRWKLAHADFLSYEAGFHKARNELHLAVAAALAGCRILDSLAETYPQDMKVIHDAVAIHQAAGDLLIDPSQPATSALASQKHFERALRLSEVMHEHDAQNLDYQMGLAMSLMHLARSHLAQKHPADALAPLSRARNLLESALSKAPGELRPIGNFMSLLNLEQMALMETNGRTETARILRARAEESWIRTLANPESAVLHRRLTLEADNAAYCLCAFLDNVNVTNALSPEQLLQTREAVAEYQRWLDRLTKMMNQQPTNFLWAESLARMSANISFPYAWLKDYDRQLASLELSKHLRQELIASAGHASERIQRLAESYHNLVTAYANANRWPEAIRIVREALAWFRTQENLDAETCEHLLEAVKGAAKPPSDDSFDRASWMAVIADSVAWLGSQAEIKVHTRLSTNLAALHQSIPAQGSLPPAKVNPGTHHP